MPWALQFRDDAHAVAVDNDIVLLDAAADRYLFLPQAAAEVRLGAGGRVEALSDRARELLLASGLAGQVTADRARDDPPPLPTRALPGGRFKAQLGWPGTWRLALSVLDATVHYRGRSFAQILAYVRLRRGGRAPSPGADVARLAATFERAAIWLPIPRKCLVRSFVLLRFLQRSGGDADWVLGVRVAPFAAHCWLQAGDLALDDVPERLLGYRPICVV